MASFPDGFVWGAATAAHQVEGNNVNSDLWVLEHCSPTLFEEPSLDACDHYHRYSDDIRLLAGLGLNCYRFSLEWARIEPERGHFSLSAMEHYRRMLAACHENGVKPMVTFSHFSSPRWFAGFGGWEKPAAADLFARYCEHAARHLGDLISFASTFNEPNLPMLLRWISHIQIPVLTVARMARQAARAIGSRQFGCFFLGDADRLQENIIAAHVRAHCALKAGPGAYPVGINIALQDEQAIGPKSVRDKKCAQVYDPWLAAAADSDFLGVQSYTRCRVGKKGDLGPEPGVELTQMGYEIWPDAIEACLRYAAARAGVPIYITESGIATEDDLQRVDFIKKSLTGVLRCLSSGIDIRGYIHWSLMDNFEWIMGYRPKFGLIAVDRTTQCRTVKPSARYLGEIARQNRLPDLASPAEG
jgi:beta-glucosidase